MTQIRAMVHGILRWLGAVLVLLAIGALILRWDQPIARYVHAIATEPATALAALVGELGDPAPYVVIVGIVFVHFVFSEKHRLIANRALFILLAVAVPGFSADVVKVFVGRSRPLLLEHGVYVFRPLNLDWDFASFPSEHAAVAAAVAAALSVLLPVYRATFFLLAVIVGVSQIVLEDHYLSDVLAGVLLGMGMAAALKAAFDRFGLQLVARPLLVL